MTLNIILDIVISLLIVVGGIIGVCCGFVKFVSGPLKFVGSFAIAFSLADVVSVKLVEPWVNAPIANQIEQFVLNKTAADPNAELPTLVKFAAGLVNIDLDGKTVSEIITELAQPLVHIICVVVTFVILYFLAKLLLWFVFWLLDLFFNSTLLVVPNKVVGTIFGVLFAALIVWLLVVIFNFIVHIPSVQENEWAANFTGGPVFRFFTRISPLGLLLSF